MERCFFNMASIANFASKHNTTTLRQGRGVDIAAQDADLF